MPPVTLPGTPTVPQTLQGLSTGAPVGPLPVTPYAPANVQPLWMPSEVPGKPPKIVQPQRNQFPFGGGAGADGGPGAAGPMPGTAQGSPRNTDAVPGSNFADLTPAQQRARIAAGNAPPPTYGANVMAKLLSQQGIDPNSVMPNYGARLAQSQPTAAPRPAVAPQTSIHPAAAPSLSQTLAKMGVPQQLHPQIMQSVLQPGLLGGGSPRNM